LGILEVFFSFAIFDVKNNQAKAEMKTTTHKTEIKQAQKTN